MSTTASTTKKFKVNGNNMDDDIVIRAQNAIQQYPNSDIEVAMAMCPIEFCSESNDRLLKFGRRIVYMVKQYHKSLQSSSSNKESNEEELIHPLRLGLQLLIDECHILLKIRDTNFKVPTVRFGKTNIQMPIITLGCMRFQQEWGPRITHMNQVGSDCQDNLVAILHQAIVQYGMVHIETARGYGCSELQLGVALQQLYKTTSSLKRSDLILQTKIPPNPDPVSFREAIELSMKHLQVDYVDLFAFHGMNFEEQYEWVFGQNGNNCLSIVQEYMAAGKIRHLGFSTHGSTEFITKCIQTDVFEYVNLHYHYFGSYTASGLGTDGTGNLDCIKLLMEKDIGRFIISPFDKGGRLYAPSQKLCSLTLPDMEPMTFQSWWVWNHHRLYSTISNNNNNKQDDPSTPHMHTYTVGAARPSDLDQPMMAAYLHATQPDVVIPKLKAVTTRLDTARETALGKEWLTSWYKGLPKNTESKHLIEHNQMVWIYNCIKAYGMYEFGKARYNTFEKNNAKWDETKSDEENINVVGKNGWGFVPGRPLKRVQGMVDYTKDDLVNVPESNKKRIVEAEEFVYHWCRDRSLDPMGTDSEKKRDGFIRRTVTNALKGGATATTTTDEVTNEPLESIPEEWETAYDLRTWPDFPDQPSRGL